MGVVDETMRGVSTFCLRGLGRLAGACHPSCTSVRRLFWVGLFLLHAVGLRLAWGRSTQDGGSGAAAVELFGLSLSLFFFALKIADVGFLRLNPGWRSFVAASAIVALLHVNVLNRAAEGRALAPVAEIPWAQVVGTVLVLELARRVARHLRAGTALSRHVAHRQVSLAFCGLAVADALRRPDWPAATGPRTLRGPPISL